jgi:peptidyl-tRNA hydrolase, PTH1 family
MLPNPSIQLIVGLGNPGPTYAKTRHNAGAWMVETLGKQLNTNLKTDSKFNARTAQTSISGQELRLLISNTYMNHSGQAVSAIAKYYQIPVNAILIAHDELDLPPGVVRLKTDGGHGGHNGLRDIIAHLGGRDFHRLRIGIGHPGHRDEVHDYVLHEASKHEEKQIFDAIDEALMVLPQIIKGDWPNAMNRLHSFSSNIKGDLHGI